MVYTPEATSFLSPVIRGALLGRCIKFAGDDQRVPGYYEVRGRRSFSSTSRNDCGGDSSTVVGLRSGR